MIVSALRIAKRMGRTFGVEVVALRRVYHGRSAIDFVYGYYFKDRGNSLQLFVRRFTVASQ